MAQPLTGEGRRGGGLTKQVIGTAKSDFASVVQLLLDARVDPNCLGTWACAPP